MTSSELQKKYYTIGEVVELINIPAYVIRFWEKNFESLQPQKARGRRYYKKNDIDQLNIIKKLLYVDKISIKVAKNILYSSKFNKTVIKPINRSYSQLTYQEFISKVNVLLTKFISMHERLNLLLKA